MTDFPDPSDIRVELQLAGVWTDITSDVYQRDEIQITRGRSGEGGTTEASRCSLTINNRSGDYSPRNPVGAHFGVLGRNTPLRVVTGPEVEGLWLDGASGSYASTDNAAHLQITGDIDIRVRVALDDWTAATQQTLVSKWLGTGNQLSFLFQVLTGGQLRFDWSEGGASSTGKTSSIAVTATDEDEMWVRVTLDVDNGSTQNEVKFWTSDDGETWGQLGSTRTTAGTTSIFASTTDLFVGATQADGSTNPMSGIVGYVDIRDVIDGDTGDIVADPDFSAQARNDTEFDDDSTNTWTVNGTAALTGPSTIRFTGEVSSWPQRWDPSGADVWVPIEAAGILRRLGQGASPLRSALFRGASTLDNAVAYWPCEDAEGATALGSGLAGHSAMEINRGTPTLATYEGFIASAPIPTVGTSKWIGRVPEYADAAEVQLRFLMAIPAAGLAAESAVVALRTVGKLSPANLRVWVLEVSTAGSLRLRGFDGDGVVRYNGPFVAFAVNGKKLWVSIELKQNSTNIDTRISTLEVGESVGSTYGEIPGAFSQLLTNAQYVALNTNQSDLTDVAIGHVLIQDEITSLDDLNQQLAAWSGERASRRIERLCDEEGITFPDSWNHTVAVKMGPQLPKTFLDLLREAEAADMGILFEQRDVLGLDYRQRASLQVQDVTATPTTGLLPTLELDYSAADLSSIEPVDDDQNTRNDVTVKREGGSEARAALTEGPLSILPPPDGVGTYDDSPTISVESDTALPDQASWRLHVGTVDEARYPRLGINLVTDSFTSDDTLTAASIDLDIGDKVTVSNPPAWLPPDDISQIVQGYTETLRTPERLIDINCAPASPFNVAIWDDATGGPGEFRWESAGSTLDEDLDTTETAVDVATPKGPLWTDDDQPFDINIGGERMTVTAVTGATSPQTLTVTRSVNSVAKAHSSGAEVRLWKQARYAL